MIDEKQDRRKIYLYKRLFKEETIILNDEELRIAQGLVKEKMAKIRGNRITLLNECDMSYAEQRFSNEKRYKTFIRYFQMDKHGVRSLTYKMILPFHQEIYEARDMFFRKYPDVKETNVSFLEIEHADIVLKEYIKVYHQGLSNRRDEI